MIKCNCKYVLLFLFVFFCFFTEEDENASGEVKTNGNEIIIGDESKDHTVSSLMLTLQNVLKTK
jgi:hypothetical protein